MKIKFENLRGMNTTLDIPTDGKTVVGGDRKSTTLQHLGILHMVAKRPADKALAFDLSTIPNINRDHQPWAVEGLGMRLCSRNGVSILDHEERAKTPPYLVLVAGAHVMGRESQQHGFPHPHRHRHSGAVPRADGNNAREVFDNLLPEVRTKYFELLGAEVSICPRRAGRFLFDGHPAQTCGDSFLYEALVLLWSCSLYQHSRGAENALLIVDNFAPAMNPDEATFLLRALPTNAVVASEILPETPGTSFWED